MSTEQRENLDAILRQSAFPADSDVGEQRRLLRELTAAQPLPAGVTVTAAALGGVPTAEVTVDGIEPRHVVLYFHGGVYVLGDAFQAAGLASQVGRRTRARVVSVDYRLAPEHPYPAAVDDALAAYQALLEDGTGPSDIAFAGGIWQARAFPGAQIVNEPGAMCWNEQLSRDFEGSKAFYAAVFGYGYGDMSGGFSYATFKVDGRDVGGIGGLHAGVPAGTPAGWRVYFGAADTDASVARLQANGGSVIREPIHHPYGRMSTVADDQGALFSLLGVTRG